MSGEVKICCHSQSKRWFPFFLPERDTVEVGSCKTHWWAHMGVGLTCGSENLWDNLGQVNFYSLQFLLPGNLVAALPLTDKLYYPGVQGASLQPLRLEEVFLCVLPASLPTSCTKPMCPPEPIACIWLFNLAVKRKEQWYASASMFCGLRCKVCSSSWSDSKFWATKKTLVLLNLPFDSV